MRCEWMTVAGNPCRHSASAVQYFMESHDPIRWFKANICRYHEHRFLKLRERFIAPWDKINRSHEVVA